MAALVLVFLTAVVVHGVSLSAGQWIALLAVSWVGVLPVAALGLAIGFATGAEAAFGVLYANTTSLPGLLQSLFGYDATTSGLVLSPAGIGVSVTKVVRMPGT